MLAWILLVASAPTIVCAICSAFLAYKERPQWVWFAVLAVLAGIGGAGDAQVSCTRNGSSWHM